MMRQFLGELYGTFILVFIGCGSVAAAVFLGWFDALWQVALAWGVGVALAIYASKIYCPAHLNPAVSFAMWVRGDVSSMTFLSFCTAQLVGAFAAGVTIYFLFEKPIESFETAEGIIRGETGSSLSAMAFGEFFPNPGYVGKVDTNHLQAVLYEAGATLVLVKMIFLLIRIQNNLAVLVPLFIGLTVTLLILLVAPYTQAGMNPARDFGPRLFASIAGWGRAAFPDPFIGFFTVYIAGPLVGALIAALSERRAG